jgi:CO/xanthine dehydrogenase FAD-binding subunit
MEVAVVGLAVRLALTDDGEAVTSVGIAAGAVAARPFRATAAEEALVGGPLTAGRIDEAGALLAEQADPIDDYRASARYRRRLLPSLLKRALHSCRLAGGRR